MIRMGELNKTETSNQFSAPLLQHNLEAWVCDGFDETYFSCLCSNRGRFRHWEYSEYLTRSIKQYSVRFISGNQVVGNW